MNSILLSIVLPISLFGMNREQELRAQKELEEARLSVLNDFKHARPISNFERPKSQFGGHRPTQSSVARRTMRSEIRSFYNKVVPVIDDGEIVLPYLDDRHQSQIKGVNMLSDFLEGLASTPEEIRMAKEFEQLDMIGGITRQQFMKLLKDNIDDLSRRVPGEPEGRTLLMVLVDAHMHILTELLIKADVDCEVKDLVGKTAINKARESNNSMLINAIQHALDRDAEFIRALCEGDFLKVQDWLKKKKVDPNLKEDKGSRRTAIMIAASRNISGSISTLVKFGGEVNRFEEKTKKTALMYAVESCLNINDRNFDTSAESVEVLLENHAKPNRQDCNGNTALHLALTLYPKVETLLKAQNASDIDIKRTKGILISMIKLLMQYGADLDLKNNEGMTARQMILDLRLAPEVEKGFRRKVTKKTKSDDEVFRDFLEVIRKYSRKEVVSYLDRHELDLVSLHDSTNQTALMVAAERGDIDIVRCLLDYGANAKVQDSNGKTALDKAIEHEHELVARELHKVTEDTRILRFKPCNILGLVGNHLRELAKKVDVSEEQVAYEHQLNILCHMKGITKEVLEAGLQRGGDVNKFDSHRKTMLLYLADAGFSEICRRILLLGADPNVFDPIKGETPLIKAVRRRDIMTAKALIDGGAVVLQQNPKTGLCAYGYAQEDSMSVENDVRLLTNELEEPYSYLRHLPREMIMQIREYLGYADEKTHNAINRATIIMKYMEESMKPIYRNYLILKGLKNRRDQQLMFNGKIITYDQIVNNAESLLHYIHGLPHENEFMLFYILIDPIYLEDLFGFSRVPYDAIRKAFSHKRAMRYFSNLRKTAGKNSDDYTALMVTAALLNPKTVDILLRAKAHPNAVTFRQRKTALRLVIDHLIKRNSLGKEQALEEIIKELGIDFYEFMSADDQKVSIDENIANWRKRTLNVAIDDCETIVRLLLDKGANVSLVDAQGVSVAKLVEDNKGIIPQSIYELIITARNRTAPVEKLDLASLEKDERSSGGGSVRGIMRKVMAKSPRLRRVTDVDNEMRQAAKA